MAHAEFVYTTFIRTTPEQLWQALTDPGFTRRYWGATFETDWAVGSPMVWEYDGVKMADPEQVVLESDPYRRLAYTWHGITAEFATHTGIDDDLRAQLNGEARSRVSFTLEPQPGDVVKLTVLHEAEDTNSAIVGMVSEGWPALLSSPKTLLETGEALPDGSAPSQQA